MNGTVTPDTTGYLLMGLAFIAIIIGTYVLTLIYRMRKADQQIAKVIASE